MVLCGLAIGWRVQGSAADAAAAFGVIILFALAMAWVGAVTGLIAPNVEVAQSIGFLWMFPVTFLSSAFISAASLPGPLRTIAEWNPVTAVATTSREHLGNGAPSNFVPPSGWVADHALGYSIGASLVILAVCMPLSLMLYRRAASR